MIIKDKIEPPWIQYPNTEPWWGGWRQGESEEWLLRGWLPFWRGLDEDARAEYLRQWPPPDDDWKTYLTVFWK